MLAVFIIELLSFNDTLLSIVDALILVLNSLMKVLLMEDVKANVGFSSVKTLSSKV